MRKILALLLAGVWLGAAGPCPLGPGVPCPSVRQVTIPLTTALPPGWVFTRAGNTATMLVRGVVTPVNANIPRFETDAAGNSLGYRNEPAAPNSVPYSTTTTAYGTTASAVVASQGARGYTNNDIVTVTGGTFTTATQLKLTVSAGNITAADVQTAGAYQQFPVYPVSGISGPVNVTGGTGSGATFNLTLGAGVLPNGWVPNYTTVYGTGTENGISYVDVRFYFTSATTFFLPYTGITTIATSTGQVWTESQYVALVAGSTANVTAFQADVYWYDSSSAPIGQGVIAFTPLAPPMAQYSSTQTTTGATAYVRGALRIPCSGAADFVLRIGAPQVELGALPTSFIPTAGTAITRNADNLSAPLSLYPWLQTPNGFSFAVRWTQIANALSASGVVASFATSLFTTNSVYIVSTTSGTVFVKSYINSSVYIGGNYALPVAGTQNTLACSVRLNGIDCSLNRGTKFTLTTVGWPSALPFLALGNLYGQNSYLPGHIFSLTLRAGPSSAAWLQNGNY